MKTKIVVTGGDGRFASLLKKTKTKYIILFPSKKTLDITNYQSVKKYLSFHKPKIVIHLAALSRPMSLHEKNIIKSINLNIIGTANVTKVCAAKNIKIVYFSTSYVYPGKKGNYKESDSLLPVNNYAWSKLGGESAVQIYKNSLILRLCMTARPFIHKAAFKDVKTSFIYQDQVAKILFKLINKRGIINVGGITQSVFDFAKKENPYIKKIFLKKNKNIKMPKNSSINIDKMRKILKK